MNLELEKLKKKIYNSKIPFPQGEGGELRNLFQYVFTDLMNDIIQGLKIQNKLIYLLTSIINPLLDEYNSKNNIQSRFMFRGGNILKIYKDKFQNRLSKEGSNFIKENFQQYFEFSDIDFMIYINNESNTESSERKKHRDNIQVICHYALSLVRDKIYETDLINTIYHTVEEHRIELLNEVNEDKLESSIDGIVKSEFTDILFQQADIRLDNPTDEYTLTSLYLNKYYKDNTIMYPDFASITKNHFKALTITDEPKYQLYITDNDKIRNIQINTYFRLSRLLVDFLLVYVTENDKQGLVHTFGELYDLSIINKGDIMYNIYNDNTTFLTDLRFHEGDEKVSFQIRIPKLKTAIIDLMRLLFSNRFPWSDPKYEKRVYRLYVLLYIYEVKKRSKVSNTAKKDVAKVLNGLSKYSDSNYKDLGIIDLKMIRRNYNYMRRFELSKTNSDMLDEFEGLIIEIEKLLIDLNKL